MGLTFFVSQILATAGAALAVSAQASTQVGIDAWKAGDYTLAVEKWSASTGDAEAQYRLGEAYRLGKGVDQDLAKAEEMFAGAAARGHSLAADTYGLLLFARGEKSRALPYLRAAADRGDARAQYVLGLSHFNADLVERDWPRAFALLELSRRQGLAQADKALQQIDRYISADQRVQGLAMADANAATPPHRSVGN